MSFAPAVSVVVASLNRPSCLRCCLIALSQQSYDNFELVVVADAAGAEAGKTLAFSNQIKWLENPGGGISAARNAGLAAAAGELVAFIDDDAVAEPTWLAHLMAGFVGPEIHAVGGYVRGRNGISFQWKARHVDASGIEHALELADTAPQVVNAPAGHAVKTEGTNMAFRRATLMQLGGFDPALRYFLDETDLNMRLAKAGHATAIAPLAQVHHGFAANAQRHANRAPRSLFEIGASVAVFSRKHAPEISRQTIDRVTREQRQRLAAYRKRGLLTGRAEKDLLASLSAGFAEGSARPITPPKPLTQAAGEFRPFPRATPKGGRVFGGWVWHREKLFGWARAAVASGHTATVFLFAPSPRRHRMAFHEDGFWVQSGGLFGQSLRVGPALVMHTVASRLKTEHNYWAQVRNFNNG